MNNYEISVSRGTKGFGLSLIYRGLDKFPAPETGIFVARVVPGGNSHRAGLQENDKVLRINKKAPRDVDEAVNIIKKAGKQLVVTIGRKQPDIIQGDTKPVPRLSVVQLPAPLSRSGSVRSINTQFAQSRPQTPDSSEEEDERNQGGRSALMQSQAYEQQQYELQQQQLAQQQYQQQQFEQQQFEQQQFEQQQFEQQQYEQQQRQLLAEQQLRQQQAEQQKRQQLVEQQQRQLYEQELVRERAAIEEENRKLQLKQQALARQQEQWNIEQIRQKKESARSLNHQDYIANVLGGVGGGTRDDAVLPRRSVGRGRQIDESSGDEGDFNPNRRAKSVGASGRFRSKSPGSFSVKSGISLFDLSEMSTTSKMSRFEEKDHMQGLNNRLAGYIDKVRQLQTENRRMTRQVEVIESSQMKEISNIKALYGNEVRDLKSAIDNIARNYRDLQASSDKVLQVNRDLKSQVNKRSTDVKTRNDSIQRLKDDITRLRNRVMASEKDKSRVEEKLNDILPDVEKTQEKINETVFQINDVKKVNADLQLQAQRLNVELKDKVDIMDSRVKEVKSRKQMEVTEIAGKLEREYEDRVQKALATLREVYENQVKEGKNEFTKKYEKRVSDLQSALSKERYKNNSTGQGLDETNRRVTALVSKVKYLEEQREGLHDRIENMGEKLREQDSGHKRQILLKDDEIKKILNEIHNQLQEYQNLMDTKTALDMEIAVYRKLVESEEDRLGIDIRDDMSQSLSSSRGCSTPASPKLRYHTYKASEETTAQNHSINQTQL